MMLADMPVPTSLELGGWIVCLVAVMAGLNQAFKLKRNVTGQAQSISPQPFEVKAAADYVHKTDFERHIASNTAEHQNLFAKLGGIDRGLRETLKKDTDALHEKINTVTNQNAGQTAKLDLVNQRQVQMDGKIDRLLERHS